MKKYSDKFLNQSNKLKFARVGFEFEFYMKELSYYKTLELLNIELAPVKMWGFRQYHSDFTPDEKNFKIEPDLSGGSNMVELVTGPLNYYDAKYYLVKIIKFIQTYGYTNEKSSVHFNLSFNGEKDLNDLNILKLVLNTDEDEIYRIFPSRKDNVYAKSVKKMITNKTNIPRKTSGNRIQDPPRECGDYQSSQVPGKLLRKTATSQSWTNTNNNPHLHPTVIPLTTISPRNMATCIHLAN